MFFYRFWFLQGKKQLGLTWCDIDVTNANRHPEPSKSTTKLIIRNKSNAFVVLQNILKKHESTKTVYNKNILLMNDVNITIIIKQSLKKSANLFCLKCVTIELPKDTQKFIKQVFVKVQLKRMRFMSFLERISRIVHFFSNQLIVFNYKNIFQLEY